MPFIRFIVSEHYTCVVAIILLLGEIMPTCSCCVLKGLMCVIIAALSNYQPSSCSKCIKSNMHLSYNVHSILNTKYAFFTRFTSL